MRINSTLYYILKDHLGSASVVTDASGTILGEQRYYPFGETRVTTGTIYTDRLFTGQREMAGLGIYHFNARFYSPKLGRFLSADTIVPGYANPQSLNRFSYVTNNPLRYIDPSGNIPIDCYNDPSYCSNTTTLPDSPYPSPPDDDDNDNLPNLPNIEDIPNPTGWGPGVRNETLKYYLSIRKLLWQQCSTQCVDPVTGMIKDEYLVALIILGEFGAYKGGPDNNVYLEGLEAISNQYYSAADLGFSQVGGMLCNGSCTAGTQLSWLYDIEAVRSDNLVGLVSRGLVSNYLNDAKLAVAPGGFTNGVDSSWFWGNVSQAELSNYFVTAQTSDTYYDETDYFIVHAGQK